MTYYKDGTPSNEPCEHCDDNGWLFIFNTKTNVDELQKCDNCDLFLTDKEAVKHVSTLY